MSAPSQPTTRLGYANLALLSLYFIPVWGREAMRGLLLPFAQEEGVQTAFAGVAAIITLGPDSVILISQVVAGIKLMVAAAFVACAIEFARSQVTGREPDFATMNTALILAVVGVLICAVPALASGTAASMHLHVTHALMVGGAALIVLVEQTLARRREAAQALAVQEGRPASYSPRMPIARLSPEAPPPAAAAALARIPESRLRSASPV